jgi:mRNA export factor
MYGQAPASEADVAVPGCADGISSLQWSSKANHLLAGCWDSTAYIWNVNAAPMAAQPMGQLKAHTGPVLDVAWSEDGQSCFTASTDKTARMWSLAQMQTPGYQGQVVAQHDAPIKAIHYVNEMNMVVTGSWDKTIRYWDVRQATGTAAATVQIPDKCYALDVRYPLLVCATAGERQVLVYDLRNPGVLAKTVQSPLKMQTRCVAAFPDASGFAIGSVEGRVGIHYVDDSNAAKNFAFKCHRDVQKATNHGRYGQAKTEPPATIYPVNAIAFHRIGTFATCGSDGVFNFWDKDKKQRLKQFAKNTDSISCGSFNVMGDVFAYAVSYDWCKGGAHRPQGGANTIMLHKTLEAEIKPKST